MERRPLSEQIEATIPPPESLPTCLPTQPWLLGGGGEGGGRGWLPELRVARGRQVGFKRQLALANK